MGFAADACGAFARSVKQKTCASSALCISSPKHLYKEISPVIAETHLSSTLSFWGKYLFNFLLVPRGCSDWGPANVLAGWAGSGTDASGAEGSRAWELQAGDLELTPMHWDQPALLKQQVGSTSHLLMLSSNLGTDFNLSWPFSST